MSSDLYFWETIVATVGGQIAEKSSGVWRNRRFQKLEKQTTEGSKGFTRGKEMGSGSPFRTFLRMAQCPPTGPVGFSPSHTLGRWRRMRTGRNSADSWSGSQPRAAAFPAVPPPLSRLLKMPHTRVTPPHSLDTSRCCPSPFALALLSAPPRHLPFSLRVLSCSPPTCPVDPGQKCQLCLTNCAPQDPLLHFPDLFFLQHPSHPIKTTVFIHAIKRKPPQKAGILCLVFHHCVHSTRCIVGVQNRGLEQTSHTRTSCRPHQLLKEGTRACRINPYFCGFLNSGFFFGTIYVITVTA